MLFQFFFILLISFVLKGFNSVNLKKDKTKNPQVITDKFLPVILRTVGYRTRYVHNKGVQELTYNKGRQLFIIVWLSQFKIKIISTLVSIVAS